MTDPTRAALSQPEPEGLSDEELMELMPQQFRDDLATVSRMAAYGAGSDVGPGLFRVSLNTGALAFARAVLARWGTPNSAETGRSLGEPVDGEVAELATAEMVRQLRTKAATDKVNRCHYSSTLLTRAADLLERLSPPQPVPVSERLPEPGDCEDEGWAWFFNKRIGWRQAVLPVSPGFTHWLPAHALPLPGDVEG